MGGDLKTDRTTPRPAHLQDAGNAVRRGIQCPGWAVAGAAMAGRSHLRSQTPCQDAFAIEATDSGFVAVLCDGAGSAVHSELGAREVSRAVCDFLAENSEQDLDPQRIIACALEPIKALTTGMEAEPGDFACTLVAVKVTGDCAFLYHLGDGAVIASRAGEARVASRPSRGEFANSTVFVTSADAVAALRIRTIPLDPTTRTIVLTTDGLQDLFLDNATGEASQVCEQMATWHDADLPEFVADKLSHTLRDFFLPRTHDDCSLVIARRMTHPDEALPVVCPECARWIVTARRVDSRFHFQCHGCGCEFTSDQILRGGILENVRTPSPVLDPAEAFSAAVFLDGKDEGADRQSSRWVAKMSRLGARQLADPLGGVGVLRQVLGKALSCWKSRRLDNPPVLILGEMSLGKRLPVGRIMVAVAILKDGKREVVWVGCPDKNGSSAGIIESLLDRGATSPAIIVCQAKLGREGFVTRIWPQATVLTVNRKVGKSTTLAEGDRRPEIPCRLRSLAAIRSLERDVKAMLKGIQPASREAPRCFLWVTTRFSPCLCPC